jgi:propionyl-CoA synthetase
LETGWPIAALSLGIEAKAVKPGSPTHPVPGYDVVVVGESSNPVPAGVQGEIVVRQPLPPGTLTTLQRRRTLSGLVLHLPSGLLPHG